MELRQIKELMAAMGRCGVSKVVLKKEGEFELQLERQESSQTLASQYSKYEEGVYPSPLPVSRPSEPLFTPHQIITPVSHGKAVEEEVGKFVTSPMVGSFYLSPSPDDPPFVKVGDKVEPHTVVCIVEAMKVMNEVKAGVSGVITEMLLTNGNPVEFGTKLFRLSN